MPAWKRRLSESVKDKRQPDKHKQLQSNVLVRRLSGELVKKQNRGHVKKLRGANARKRKKESR